MLLVGRDQWPFAMPLMKTDQGWQFDTDTGIEEINARRIGLNERLTIAACFFERDPDSQGVKHYARRLMSSEGRKDGLHWPVTGNEDPSPIGPVLATAATRADERGERIPYHGYRYKLLTRQGEAASGGAVEYETQGMLTEGWAAVASPDNYAITGVMTFIISHDGIVYEQDLGPETARLVNAMTSFNPSSDWEASKSMVKAE